MFHFFYSLTSVCSLKFLFCKQNFLLTYYRNQHKPSLIARLLFIHSFFIDVSSKKNWNKSMLCDKKVCFLIQKFLKTIRQHLFLFAYIIFSIQISTFNSNYRKFLSTHYYLKMHINHSSFRIIILCYFMQGNTPSPNKIKIRFLNCLKNI